MATYSDALGRGAEDPVSNVLKWILLAVAIMTFSVLGWTTDLTYKAAPPFPERFVAPDGSVLMSAADIQAGKAGFQRADLMDYGSLYGMGSYFGEDYTASNLVLLGTLTEDNIAKAKTGKALAELSTAEQAAVRAAMQAELQGVDLSRNVATIPAALAAAITTLKGQIGQSLLHSDFAKGWTQAYSLDAQSAAQTAEFLIYSSLTTVARRPGIDVSWTQNWPYEPLVGNTPTTGTFRWTWISFCFTFFAFGAVLFIYESYSERSRQGADGSSAFKIPAADAEPAKNRQILSRRRRRAACCRSSPARSWPITIRSAPASTASRSIAICRSISCATSISRRRSCGSPCRGSGLRCSWRRRSAEAKPKAKPFLSMCCSG